MGETIDAVTTKTQATDPQAYLITVAKSYVNFALAHPHHLMVMFGEIDPLAYPELGATAQAAFQRLVDVMAQHTDALRDQPPEQLALVLWINVHGLSALLISDKIPEYATSNRAADVLTEMSIRSICQGILAPTT